MLTCYAARLLLPHGNFIGNILSFRVASVKWFWGGLTITDRQLPHYFLIFSSIQKAYQTAKQIDLISQDTYLIQFITTVIIISISDGCDSAIIIVNATNV